MTSSDIAANRSCIEVHLADPPLIASAATSMIATTMCTKYLCVRVRWPPEVRLRALRGHSEGTLRSL